MYFYVDNNYCLWYNYIDYRRIFMKRNKMTNVTFSLPIELNNALHAFIGKRGLSRFVAKAIERELKKEKMSFRQEFAEANQDQDRLKTITEWENLDLEGWK